MEEIDLKAIFNIFWNKKIQILLIIIFFLAIGVFYTKEFTTPMYASSTTLVLASSENMDTMTNTTITATDITINSKLVATYRELVKSKDILRKVISNLEISIEEDTLRRNVEVASRKNTELIEITVQNENPSEAASIANEIAKAFTEKVKEIYNINNVQIVDEAEMSTEPSNINPVKDVAMFGCIGVIIAFAYVIISTLLDTTIKTSEEIEKNFHIPVLASIPKIEKIKNERKHKR